MSEETLRDRIEELPAIGTLYGVPVVAIPALLRALTDPQETTGVWVAFNYDGSALVPFATELEAYRYASGYSMTVKFARFGDDEWMKRRDEPQP